MSAIQNIDLSVNLLRAILWQYDEAEALQSLISQKNDWLDEHNSGFWSWWYRAVFNVDTAEDFGLAVWSIILDIPLGYDVPASGDRPVFGFDPYYQNFTHGNFGRDQAGFVGLSREQKRLVIKLRYFQLISRGTLPDVNYFLSQMFGDAYALDNLDMTFTVIFRTRPSAAIWFVLENFDLLPRPAGVEVKLLVRPGDYFGFDPYYQNFTNGVFAPRV